MNEEVRLWQVGDVAAYLQVSRDWVYEAAAAGRLPCIRIGALVRFSPAAVRAWVRGEIPIKNTGLSETGRARKQKPVGPKP